MIRLDNHMGKIEVSDAYFATLIGHVVSECFGVSGLVDTTPAQSLRAVLFRKEIPDKGVRVRSRDGGLTIDLYISVTYGVNISAIVKSIGNKVTYTVETVSGLRVERVNVHVAGMQVG